MHRGLELELDKCMVEWEAALAAKQAVQAQAAARQHRHSRCALQLAGLHEQRCSVVAAQLSHASQRVAQAAEAARDKQVELSSSADR